MIAAANEHPPRTAATPGRRSPAGTTTRCGRRGPSGPTEGTPDGSMLHSVIVDPRDPAHLYLGLSGGGVFESHRRRRRLGAAQRRVSRPTSCPIPTPEFGHDPHCVRLHPQQPDRLYQQNHCGIYRLDRPERRVGRASATTCRARSATSASRSSCTRATPTRRGCSRWTAPTCGRAPAPTAGRRCTSPATPARRGSARTTACPSAAWFTVKRQAMTRRRARPGRRVLRHDERRDVGQRRRGRDVDAASPQHLPEIYSRRGRLTGRA